MNCSAAIDLMGLALEGSIPARTRPEFQEHVDACRPCRTYLSHLTTTVQALGRLPRTRESNARRAALVEHFRRHTRRDEPKS